MLLVKDCIPQAKLSVTCLCNTEEEEDVDLTEQPMKWVLPPHVAGSSEAPDEITPRLRSKAEPSSSKEEAMYEPVRPKRQPGQRRHANVSTSYCVTSRKLYSCKYASQS